ncbi:MAG: hypothetical protein ACU0A9_12355 [Alterinioella nitratireducens]|uniref:hypothetical protein n=1 Tax=Alterinioella nitratireducens TaxID=2735915 RepID=UPI004058B89A
MQSEALKHSTPARSDRFARKARVLLDLIGPGGLERLQGAGLEPEILAALEQAADEPANPGTATLPDPTGLLQRFRERGMLDREVPPPRPAPSPPKADIASTLGQRIAAHLPDDALEQENPAVIAYILRAQPKSVQARVLRALPGACARATIRHMKR